MSGARHRTCPFWQHKPCKPLSSVRSVHVPSSAPVPGTGRVRFERGRLWRSAKAHASRPDGSRQLGRRLRRGVASSREQLARRAVRPHAADGGLSRRPQGSAAGRPVRLREARANGKAADVARGVRICGGRRRAGERRWRQPRRVRASPHRPEDAARRLRARPVGHVARPAACRRRSCSHRSACSSSRTAMPTSPLRARLRARASR